MVFERNKRFTGFQERFFGSGEEKLKKKRENKSDHQSDSADKYFPLQFHCNNKLYFLVIFSIFLCPIQKILLEIVNYLTITHLLWSYEK